MSNVLSSNVRQHRIHFEFTSTMRVVQYNSTRSYGVLLNRLWISSCLSFYRVLLNC